MRNVKLYNFIGSMLAVTAMFFFALYFLFLIVGLKDEQIALLIQGEAFWIFFLITLIPFPILLTAYASRKQKDREQQYVNISILKYVLAFLMFYYGYSKMHSKFFEITYLTQDSRVIDVNGFFLTWYYYGRSTIQEFLMGLLEFIPAILLLFRRTTFLGAIILFPVTTNVLLVNLFNQISGITLFVSIASVVYNTYILYGYKEIIMEFIKVTFRYTPPPLGKTLRLLRLGFKTLVIGCILFCFIVPIYIKLFGKVQDLGHRNKIMGGFELYSLNINGVSISPNDETRYYKAIYLEPQSRWNTVLTFSANTKPVGLLIKWNRHNDSVVTYTKLSTDVEHNKVDSTSLFIGTYKLKDKILYIDGIQNSDTIHAIFNKKPLKDYKWFW